MEYANVTLMQLGWRDLLDTSITEEELKAAVSQGRVIKLRKEMALCLEFFTVYWDSFKVDMFFPTQTDVLGWSDNGKTEVWHRSVHSEDRHSHHTSGL
jgi:hypothetical protein